MSTIQNLPGTTWKYIKQGITKPEFIIPGKCFCRYCPSKELTQKEVGLKSLTEKVIDTTNKNDHISNAMLGMLAVFGQLERDLIRERVREGVAIAKSQGKMKGRGRPKALGVLDV